MKILIQYLLSGKYWAIFSKEDICSTAMNGKTRI